MYKVVVRLKFKVVCMFVVVVFGYVLLLGFVFFFVMLRFYGYFNNSLFYNLFVVSCMV